MKLLLAAFLLCAGIAGAQIISVGVVPSNGVKIGVANNCGPPLLLCSSSSTANAGTVAAIFTSTAPTPTTCAGDCQNTVRYDTSINPFGVDPWTRITDRTSSCGAAGLSMSPTSAASANERMWSKNADFLALATTGGSLCIFHLNLSAPAVQVANAVTGPAIAGSFASSITTDTRFYRKGNSSTIVQQCDIAGGATYTCATLVDVGAAGVCPGLPNPFTATSGSVLNVAASDDKFIFGMSNAGGQGTGVWLVTWSRTLGCRVVNYGTNTVWDFCTGGSCGPGTTPLGSFTTGCWGITIHDVLAFGDGNFALMSMTGQSGGGSGDCPNGALVYDITATSAGSLSNISCSGTPPPTGTSCVDHSSPGFNKLLSNSFSGAVVRSNATPSILTQFTPPYSPVLEDWHSSWCDPAGDGSCPAIIASDGLITSNGSGCGNPIFCPIYLHNEIFAIFPGGIYPPGSAFRRVGHTFSCGFTGAGKALCPGGPDAYFAAQDSIGSLSPDGKYLAIASTMFGTLGTDPNGNPGMDTFVISMQ